MVLYKLSGPYSIFLEFFDFNIHLNQAADPLSRAFQAIIDSLGFQWVGEPTHCEGNTLDLILSYGVEVTAMSVSTATFAVSGHFLIRLN